MIALNVTAHFHGHKSGLVTYLSSCEDQKVSTYQTTDRNFFERVRERERECNECSECNE